jgi:hypothetical protein
MRSRDPVESAFKISVKELEIPELLIEIKAVAHP